MRKISPFRAVPSFFKSQMSASLPIKGFYIMGYRNLYTFSVYHQLIELVLTSVEKQKIPALILENIEPIRAIAS